MIRKTRKIFNNCYLVSIIMRYQEYGLLASVNRGLIPIICDAGMRGFEDPDDVNDMVADFAGIHTQSQSDHFQYQVATIETEIDNFLRQNPAHFSKCKLNS